jgi:hypothetical protein
MIMATSINKREFNINLINIKQINVDFEIALKSTSLVLSDKLKIALVLIERMTESTVDVLIKTIYNMKVLNSVLIVLLRESCQYELSNCKNQFIEKSVSKSNYYIYSNIFNEITDQQQLNTFIMNTINICNNEIIDKLLDKNFESLIFNIFRKSNNVELKKYIVSLVDKINNKNIKFYLNKGF